MRRLCRLAAGPTRVMQAMAMLALALATASCTSIVKGVAEDMAKTHLERTFSLPTSPARECSCLNLKGGPPAGSPTESVRALIGLPEAARTQQGAGGGNAATDQWRFTTSERAGLAADVLDSEVQKSLEAFYDSAFGLPGTGGGKVERHPLEVNPGKFEDYMRQVEAAATGEGWDPLEQELKKKIKEHDDAVKAKGGTPSDADKAKRAALARDDRIAVFIKEYTRAYFRNGQFITAKLDANALNALRQSIKGQLVSPTGTAIPDNELDAMVKTFLGFDPAAPIFGKLGTKGFVTRGGQNFQFQDVEATINPTGGPLIKVTDVNYTRAGSDLVRVLLHAYFDAQFGLPAVSDATGVTLNGEKVDPGIPLPVNDPNEKDGLDKADFAEVEQIASGVEAVVSSGVGRLIRGAGWVALNNEALVSTIETLVGVAARKYAEKVAWCVYTCRKEAHDKSRPEWEATEVTIAVWGPKNDLTTDPWGNRSKQP